MLFAHDARVTATNVNATGLEPARSRLGGKAGWRRYQPAPQRARGATALSADLGRMLRHHDHTHSPGLTLHYQPIVQLTQGAIRGFEALIRWTPAGRDPVPASEIINAAEHTGLIVPLGSWVIRKAIADAASIPDGPDGSQRYVSINVSPTQLRRPSFVDNVVEVLAAACVHPSKVVFEIVETQPVSPDCHETWSALRQLRELGARVAIDDYGTGYAVLGHLRQPVFDIIKLDRVFCRDIASSRSRSLIRAAVVLADDLGIELIVEGIEDDATKDTLIDLGCRTGQGYLFGVPMPFTQAMGSPGPP